MDLPEPPPLQRLSQGYIYALTESTSFDINVARRCFVEVLKTVPVTTAEKDLWDSCLGTAYGFATYWRVNHPFTTMGEVEADTTWCLQVIDATMTDIWKDAEEHRVWKVINYYATLSRFNDWLTRHALLTPERFRAECEQAVRIQQTPARRGLKRSRQEEDSLEQPGGEQRRRRLEHLGTQEA